MCQTQPQQRCLTSTSTVNQYLYFESHQPDMPPRGLYFVKYTRPQDRDTRCNITEPVCVHTSRVINVREVVGWGDGTAPSWMGWSSVYTHLGGGGPVSIPIWVGVVQSQPISNYSYPRLPVCLSLIPYFFTLTYSSSMNMTCLCSTLRYKKLSVPTVILYTQITEIWAN